MSFKNMSKAGASKSKAGASKRKAGSPMEQNVREMSEEDRPCFYRILLDNQEPKKIPTDFLKHIKEELPKTAILNVESGGSWAVKIIGEESDVFMDDGWEQFVRDNSLGDNQILVFRYDGNMCFNLKIFEKNGLERDGAHKSGMKKESAGHSNGKRRPGRPRKNPVGEDGKGHKLQRLGTSSTKVEEE